MNQSTLSMSSFTKQQQKYEEGPNGYAILKEAIVKLANGHHKWPPPDKEQVSLVYAIYMEPDLQGGFQPFWALSSRFYYIFELGWPVSVGGWFEYQITERIDGNFAGDPDFPTCTEDRCVIAGFPGDGSPFPSYVPGELLVGFQQDVDEETARQVVKRELPNSEVIEAIWSLRILQITCVPFDEPNQATRIEAASEVRYAEPNYHQHLIAPGGFWRIRRLL